MSAIVPYLGTNVKSGLASGQLFIIIGLLRARALVAASRQGAKEGHA